MSLRPKRVSQRACVRWQRMLNRQIAELQAARDLVSPTWVVTQGDVERAASKVEDVQMALGEFYNDHLMPVIFGVFPKGGPR